MKDLHTKKISEETPFKVALKQRLNEMKEKVSVKSAPSSTPPDALTPRFENVVIGGKPLSQWNLNEFLTTFSSDLQVRVINSDLGMLAHIRYPSLGDLSGNFTREGAVCWIEVQLIRFNDFIGVGNKLNDMQLADLSELILVRHSRLNMMEFCAFIARLRCGLYEKFYGSVDPHRIMASLETFLKDRNKAIARYEEQELQRRREARWEYNRLHCITYEEYLQQKNGNRQKNESENKPENEKKEQEEDVA